MILVIPLSPGFSHQLHDGLIHILFVIAAALVIIIGGINQAEPVLASFLVAVFLSVIGTPPCSSLIFWGSLLGVTGMVLSVPFTIALKFACENNKGTQWIAVLLGPEAPGPIEMMKLWRTK